MYKILFSSIITSLFFRIISTDPIPVIIDTDIGLFPDDVTAIAIMNSYVHQNKAIIRAIVANDRYEGIVPVIDAINHYFNRTNIQIGVTKDSKAHDSGVNVTWSNYVIKHHKHPMYQQNNEAENAVSLYRRMLSISEDNSVIILSIGYFTNLAHLLETVGDEYSPLNGQQLIQKKVNKMYAMAGEYPIGTEWNIEKQIDSAKKVINQWPTSIVFAGFEVGKHLRCGKGIINDSKLINSPVKEAWIISKEANQGDGCFDEVAAFISINGVEPFYQLIYGTMEILDNGTNIWHPSPNNMPTRMAYIKQIVDDQQILDKMDPLIDYNINYQHIPIRSGLSSLHSYNNSLKHFLLSILLPQNFLFFFFICFGLHLHLDNCF